jgi:hypothetical protein
MPAHTVIDNSANIFPNTVSIADLAQFLPLFKENKSKDLNIYQVEQAMSEEYSFEIEKFEFEYATGYSAWFKDGSVLHVGASADCDDPSIYGWN